MLRLIPHQLEIDSSGELATNPFEVGLGRFDDLDGVGARLPADFEDDGRHAVQPREGTRLLGAVLGVADVADANRRPVPRRDDEFVELLGLGETADRAQRPLGDRGGDVAAREVGVLLLQRRPHLADRHLVRRQTVGLDPDVDRAQQAADDGDFADARGPLERHLHDLVGDLGELANREVPRQRDRKHRRAIVVLLEDHRRVDIVGKLSQHRADAIADVLRRGVDVAIEVERDVHHRLARRRHRSQFADAFDAVDGFFDDVGDLGLDFLDRSPGE